MASIRFGNIEITAQENKDNTFIFEWFKNLNSEITENFNDITLSGDKTTVVIDYYPTRVCDIYSLLSELSKSYPDEIFATIGYYYSNMENIEEKYIVVYKNGETIFDNDYSFYKGNVEVIQEKLEADKKQWFTTKENNEVTGEKIVWRPDLTRFYELAKKQKNKRLAELSDPNYDSIEDCLPF